MTSRRRALDHGGALARGVTVHHTNRPADRWLPGNSSRLRRPGREAVADLLLAREDHLEGQEHVASLRVVSEHAEPSVRGTFPLNVGGRTGRIEERFAV